MQNKETQIEFESKCKVLLQPLESVDDLQNWLYVFLDLFFPKGTVYPDSTHGPADAMWRIYELIKTGESEHVPQVCMLASRDSFKTLGAAAMQILCMLHFRFSIAHMAAISSQSDKAIQYINAFFRKLRPYLEANGWKQSSDNKKMIAWLTDEGQEIYIRIVIATIAGANSEHVPMLCVDGNTDIMCKNLNSKTNRVRRNKKAKSIYKNFQQEIDTEVYTFNHSKGIFEFKRIIAAYKQKKQVFKVSFSNNKTLTLSEDHPICDIGGNYKPLKDFKIHEDVLFLGKQQSNIKTDIKQKKDIEYNIPEQKTDDVYQVVLGSLLGDGSVYKKNQNNAYFYEQHCKEQEEYLEWKNKILSKKFHTRYVSSKSGYTKRDSVRLETGNSEYFNQWVSFRKEVDLEKIYKMSALGLAIWFMDDGSKNNTLEFHTQSFDYNSIIKLKNVLFDNFNIVVEPYRVKNYNKEGSCYYTLRGSVSEKYKLYKICKNFIHPSMVYKFEELISKTIKNCEICNSEFTTKETNNLSKICNSTICRSIKYNQIKTAKIVNIEKLDIRDVYDFTVEDNHNFFANQVLVHNCIDEVDVVQDPRALKEAQMIPSTFNNYFPLTVYLSTRKFAGGLMEKTIKQTTNAGGEILRWNILDVTERIPHDVAKVDEPRKIRYVSRELPMHTLLEENWEKLPDETKHKYERLEAYAGIADHPFLPVMKNTLVDRPQGDYGGLYKKLSATYNNFRQLDADMADAQLLCNKPSSSGLVYPRFDSVQNVLSVQEAWEKLSGNTSPCDFRMLKQYVLDLGVTFIGGGDWGFTDWTVLPILALLPGGEIWHMDTFMAPGLEIDDIVKYGKELQEEWMIDKWWVDQNYPSYLKTLRRKAGWRCPKFTKDVAAGISALQGKIIDSTNSRKYYIIDTPNNKPVIDAFGEYRWATDGKGDIIEGKPYHDKEGVSDIMDSIRYPFQNLFSKGAKPSFGVAGQQQKDKQKQLVTSASDLKEAAKNVNSDLMRDKIASLSTQTPNSAKKSGSKKKIMW
jgi:hypothetical protein